jgi:serralysin
MPRKSSDAGDTKPPRKSARGASADAGEKEKGSRPARKRAGTSTSTGTSTGAGGGGAGGKGGGNDFDVARVYACVDRVIPAELQGEALVVALEERSDNIETPATRPGLVTTGNSMPGPGIAVFTKKLWKPGRTLRVTFLDNPGPVVRAAIEKYAHQWERFANITFVFGTDPGSEIRITCTAGKGSWSYLGTDALTIPKGQPTMNYGWFNESTDDGEFSRTVLHEFGHALGCIHEHMSPAGDIPWNRERVYQFYTSTQGWTRADVDAQLFAKYDKAQINASQYDATSIMHYPVPKDLTTNGFEVGWNKVLSEQDTTFIRQQYP